MQRPLPSNDKTRAVKRGVANLPGGRLLPTSSPVIGACPSAPDTGKGVVEKAMRALRGTAKKGVRVCHLHVWRSKLPTRGWTGDVCEVLRGRGGGVA